MFSRRLPLVLAGICLLLASAAAAAAANMFTALLTPSHVRPATSATYTITIANDPTSEKDAERAKITIPAGFDVAEATVQATTTAAGTCVASTWIADGVLIADGKINLRRAGGNPESLCAGAALTVSFSATSPTGEGPYTWATELFRGEEAFEVSGAQPTVQVDGTAPAVTITAKPSNPSNSASASFVFTSGDAGAVACALDGELAACTSPATYSGLGEGPHTFTVKATDAAGNTAEETYNWRIDLTAPTATVISGPAALGNSASATFVFSADEPSAFQCRLDSGSFAPCTSPASYHALTDGTHTFVVQPTDAAGNPGAPSSYTWTVDATAPETTLAPGPRSGTTSVSATFTFSASESATFQCRLDGAAFEPCSSPKSYAGLGRTRHDFQVRAVDAAGNVDTTPAVHSWTIASVPRRAKTSSALLAPRAGARVTSPPLLRWRRVARASYYNVQLYRGRVKVLSAWPTRARLQLRSRWTYLGRLRRLTPGTYRWYVWPGYGRPSAARYGDLLGQSTFTVAARRRR